MTIQAKNRNKWTKNTMKTEGCIANHLSTALVYSSLPCMTTIYDHVYIKATHYEWSNSKVERFLLSWLPNKDSSLCLNVLLWSSQYMRTFSIEILHNGEVKSGPHSDYCNQNKCMTYLLLVAAHSWLNRVR